MCPKMRPMSNLDNLCKRLRKVSVGLVAKVANLDRSTVRRIRDGKNTPNLTTFDKLDLALRQLERQQG